MESMILPRPLLFVIAGFIAAAACSLPAPASTGGGLSGVGALCNDTDDGGIDADDGGADDGSAGGGGDVNSVVTPVACAGTGPNPNAIDKYSQGYTQDPNILSQVRNSSSPPRCRSPTRAAQMRGMPYGNSFSVQYNDIQRSVDTPSIRGFRYRDTSGA